MLTIKFVYCLGCLHFKQRHQERECGFRSLIFIHAIGVKSVPATASGCIVKRRLQIVLAEKPNEDAAGFCKPLHLAGEAFCFKTCRDGCTGFYRLLIEARLFFSLGIESS